MRYFSKTDLIDSEIRAALGEHAAKHNIDAIADEAFEQRTDTNTAGQIVGDPYWVARPGVDFWEVVERHAL